MRPIRLAMVSLVLAAALALAVQAQAPAAGARHFPAAGTWAAREAGTLGLDKAKLDDAIAFAVANQNARTKDLAADIPATFKNEAPYNNLIGPTQERAGSNGVIIRRGYVAAEWGDTDARGHDVQRDEDVSVDGRRARVRPRPDQGRAGARRHGDARGRRPLCVRAQREDHLGTPAATDERLVGHALGQARLGRSPAIWSDAGPVAESRSCTSLGRSTSTTTRA